MRILLTGLKRKDKLLGKRKGRYGRKEKDKVLAGYRSL
jgi:hypothetical protein